MGGTVLQALQNLKDTTAGILYLDTAEYLLLTKEATEAAGELEKELKPAVQLCVVTEDVEISEAAAYLDAHGKLPRLKHWENGLDLPVLGVFEEKLIFLKKVENKA